ncbi:MAG: enoyl-CoA hydratase/isomerase family protein [Thermoleophilaceae bacterium]|nr:enoyl-CoA hydratase/isomerase family protein [Thermoleophilaceae bacterium]
MPASPVDAPVIARVEGAVGIVKLNRPDARNALSQELKEALLGQIRVWDVNPEIRAIVIAGGDHYFVAGGDLRAMAARDRDGPPDEIGAAFWRDLAAVETPLVAAVSGYALGGGCELALVCDLIVASETAEFGQAEIMVGIIPGGGGSQRLARVIGKQRAMELVLTGRRIGAEEAHRWGLVNQVAGKKDWLERAIELAALIAERPAAAVQLGKQAILAAERLALEEGLDEERRLFEQAMATEDRVEGMNAFLEKRRPEFKGR